MVLWFDSWQSLLKIFISGVVGYLILIAFIRLYGKRSTSKMNNVDWIVTVAVGSMFASMVILKNVPVLDGTLAMGILLFLQFLLTYATSHWQWARKLFLAPPSILYSDGEFHKEEMKRQRVSESEIFSEVREKGLGCMKQVHTVTLEPDAELSVVLKENVGASKTLKPLEEYQKS